MGGATVAEPSETLSHPVFGELGWLPEYSHWFTQIKQPSGECLDVIVDPGDGDRYASLEPAATLFRWAQENERRILDEAIKASILDLYNDTWRQGDDDTLTEDELAGQLKWTYLKISTSQRCTIIFSYDAGDLFGRHCLDVEVNAQLRFRGINLAG
jgi:hypothetical protein